MAEEKRATAPLKVEQPEYESDTTGNDPIEGVRHVMQDEMEAAGDGVFTTFKANKARTAAPEQGEPVKLDTSKPKRSPAKRK